MYIKENSKGVTIVTLVITVIVMAIIAGVGIYLGTGNLKSVKESKLKSELGMVQHAVLEQYTKYKTTQDKTYLIGSPIEKSLVTEYANELGISLVSIPSQYQNQDYYLLTIENLKSIGISNSEDEYIVNYVSGEVINKTKKFLSNKEPLYLRSNNFQS